MFRSAGLCMRVGAVVMDSRPALAKESTSEPA
jgi:hypothetical protein